MKRLLILLLLLLCSAGIASARDSVKGWCEEGNRPVVTSGLNSTTRVQASHPSCTITVYIHGGGLATIYADNNSTPLANPFTGQSGGRWQAYADNGRYDVTMSSAGFTQTVTYSDIILCDPFEVGSSCNNGGATQAHNLLSDTHLDTIAFSPPVRGDLITAKNLTSPTGVTPAWARLPVGASGQVLSTDGVDTIWADPPAASAHNLLSTTHLDTMPLSPPTRGALITAQNQTSPTGVNPSWALLSLGTAGKVVFSDGTDAIWGSVASGTGISVTSNSTTITISQSTAALRRTCMMIIGADNGTALANADLGPQGRQCFVPAGSTVVEVTVAADAGTPNIIPAKNHAGSASNLVSSALATAGSGGIACSNTGGTTGLDGVTTCSATLQNTSLAVGDWIELTSGTAGGTAKRMSVAVTWTVN
jgi:hypothetical protein